MCEKKEMFQKGRANGLRYLRWGGDGEAAQPGKGLSGDGAHYPGAFRDALLGAFE